MACQRSRRGSNLPSLRTSSEIVFWSLAVRPCEASWKRISKPSSPALRGSPLEIAVLVGNRVVYAVTRFPYQTTSTWIGESGHGVVYTAARRGMIVGPYFSTSGVSAAIHAALILEWSGHQCTR